MARTRWPPDWQPWPLAQARQHRDGTTGGCQNKHGTRPTGRFARQPAAPADSQVRPGPRPPTLRPYQAETQEAGPEATIPILPADSARPETGQIAGTVTRR